MPHDDGIPWGRLQRFKDSGYLLKNINSRLSDCTCCCLGLPSALYLHVVPTYEDGSGFNQDCKDVDIGTDDPGGTAPYEVTLNTQNNCYDWETDNNVDENNFACFDGAIGDNWGMEIQLYCMRPNIMRADLCIAQFGHPTGFPGSTANCDTLLIGEVPESEHTCEAADGDFLIDFGLYQPSICACYYHIYIDEKQTATLDEKNIYMYQAHGGGGLPGKLKQMTDFFEKSESIGTPPTYIDEVF